MVTLQNQLKTVAMGLALVASVALIFGVGIGESFAVVVNPSEVSADTNTTFGGSVEIVDRIAVVGAWITALTGLGALTTTGNRNLDTIVRTTPIWIAVVAITQFATDVQNVLQGDFDFSTADDNYGAFLIYLTMSTVAGILSLIGQRR